MLFAVFEAIFSFLFAVVKFLLRILTYFGLIIPLFYFLLMLVIKYIVVGSETFALYNGWYIAGLVISFVLCILYFLRTVLFKKQKPPNFSWRKKDKNLEAYQAEQSPLIPSGNIIQERVFKDPNGNIVQERTFQLPDGDKYKAYPIENNVKKTEFSETPNRYEFKTIEAPKAQLKLIDRHDEEPEIYRVKNNKQFIIKEYSDRVEIYKETPSGYEFVKCDYK